MDYYVKRKETMPKLYEGTRYKIEESDYYRVRTYLDRNESSGSDLPTWAILDERKGGYIAFTTSQEEAEKLYGILNDLAP